MPNKSRPPPIQNQLLAALPGKDYKHLLPHLEDEFEMKHEFVAMMLGVTRSVVTRAAGHLQKEKMIHYTCGRVTILDRQRLEATACECYWVVKDEYDRSADSHAQPVIF